MNDGFPNMARKFRRDVDSPEVVEHETLRYIEPPIPNEAPIPNEDKEYELTLEQYQRLWDLGTSWEIKSRGRSELNKQHQEKLLKLVGYEGQSTFHKLWEEAREVLGKVRR